MDFDHLMKARTTEVRSTAVRVRTTETGAGRGLKFTEPDASSIKGYTVRVYVSDKKQWSDTKIVG